MYRQYPDYYYRNLVAGTTAGTTSPGSMNYSAGIPTPISFGSSVPPLQASQQQTTEPQTLEQALFEIQREEGSIALNNKGYTQGYLRTLIGKLIRVEFLIGESSFQDRIGVLLQVGVDYIILREIETDDDLLCDSFSIKFVLEYK